MEFSELLGAPPLHIPSPRSRICEFGYLVPTLTWRPASAILVRCRRCQARIPIISTFTFVGPHCKKSYLFPDLKQYITGWWKYSQPCVIPFQQCKSLCDVGQGKFITQWGKCDHLYVQAFFRNLHIVYRSDLLAYCTRIESAKCVHSLLKFWIMNAYFLSALLLK